MKSIADQSGHGRQGSSAGPRKGFTLIELAIAMSLLMIGIVSVVSASSRMHTLRALNRERNLAQNGMRSVAERIHARSHGLRATPDAWVSGLLELYGPGGSAGNNFDILGLTALPGAPSVGTIQIVTDETANDDALGFELGMPGTSTGTGTRRTRASLPTPASCPSC